MINEKLELMINEFIDGELDKAMEPILFTALSEDEEAREYFKQLHAVSEIVRNSKPEFPDSLDETILTGISEHAASRKRFPFFHVNPMNAVSYAFAVVLLIISFFLYSKSLAYQESMDLAGKRINQQNEMINTLLNSLPQTEVNSPAENQIIIKTTL